MIVHTPDPFRRLTLVLLTAAALVTAGALTFVAINNNVVAATRQANLAPARQKPVISTATPIPSPAATFTVAPRPVVIPTQVIAPMTPNGCAITADEISAEQTLLSLLNSHRQAAGVAPLNFNAALANEARAHSCDMALHHLISHTGSNGSSPFQRIHAAGINYRSAGENIGTASGFGLLGGIKLNDNAMMAEPLTQYDHHWNIINAGYNQVGIGIYFSNGTEWLTEDFTG